jgi:hypothetical protein
MFLLMLTLMSMLLAAIMSVIAWRIALEERRRSEGRVAALAAEIHGIAAPPARVTRGPIEDLELRPAAAMTTRSDLFTQAQQPAASRSRLVASAAIGVFMFGTVAALAIVLSAGSRSVANPARANAATAGRTMPLELVALGHQREGDQLTVRGVVRNPAAGERLDSLTAVVFLFNHDGGFLASGRAAVESAPLGPGGESVFVVTVPGANDVERYRVSFRTDDRIVPHVDRRHEN